MHHEGSVSIWFFIGISLLVNGVLICGAGVWEVFHPPANPRRAFQPARECLVGRACWLLVGLALYDFLHTWAQGFLIFRFRCQDYLAAYRLPESEPRLPIAATGSLKY